MVLPALPSLLLRRVPNGAPIFPPQLGTLCFLTTASTHSLSASRLSRPCTNLADLMRPSLTTNSLLRSPSATSLRPVRTASHTHSSKSHSHGGVIFCFPSSTSSCASLWFRPLGSPASSSRLSSAMLDPSQGGFRWGADAMDFSFVDSLRLRRHEHTFVALIDIRKAFDSCWVEATLVRLFDFGVKGRLWHLLANFLCGTLSQVCLGGSVSAPWVDSGIAQGRILSPFFFNLTVSPSLFALPSPVSPSLPLTPSVTSASSVLMTSSFYLLLRLTSFRWPSTLWMPGVFAGVSPLVSAPQNPPQ